MDLQHTGLIVEGGGMRGAYTAGVLEVFLEQNIVFPYVIGVSAGSNTAASYLSKQQERNKRLYTEWILDKRFIGVKNFMTQRSYFGMPFLFEDIPNQLDPFSYEAFIQYEGTLKVGVTNCLTGKPHYFTQHDLRDIHDLNHLLRASSSLPVLAPPVRINNEPYLDGGIADAIPIEESIKDGNTRHVLILTRNEDYEKTFAKQQYALAKVVLRQYPNLLACMRNRHIQYNATLKKIKQLEAEGKVFVFRPQKPLEIDSFAKDTNKLLALYEEGYREAMDALASLKKWLDK